MVMMPLFWSKIEGNKTLLHTTIRTIDKTLKQLHYLK